VFLLHVRRRSRRSP